MEKCIDPSTPKIFLVILLTYNSSHVTSENLVLDQLIILYLILFLVLITCLLDFVLIM